MLGKIQSTVSRFCLGFVVLIALFLSGCVRYDVGINFAHQHQGTIVQHIKLGEQLSSFNQFEAEKWLRSIQRRAESLQGETQTISDQEVMVTIPFKNGEDLVRKFNAFFDPESQGKTSGQGDDVVQFYSQIQLNQSNWLFAERDHLNIEVDLRALGVFSDPDSLILDPSTLVNVELGVSAPWGAKDILNQPGTHSQVRQQGSQLIWTLEPGQINRLETVFWVPSYLGLGTVAIVLFIVTTYYLKYKHLPGDPQY